jgi:hypothetical protein
MTMENGGFEDAGSAEKQPVLSHSAYHFSSTAPGS